MEGDYGGSVYLTCPVRLVRCDAATLEAVLGVLDKLDWHDAEGARLYYEHLPVGSGVAGGHGRRRRQRRCVGEPELQAVRRTGRGPQPDLSAGRRRARPPHDGARRARVTGAQNRRTGTDLRGDSDAPASQDVRGVTWWAIA